MSQPRFQFMILSRWTSSNAMKKASVEDMRPLNSTASRYYMASTITPS